MSLRVSIPPSAGAAWRTFPTPRRPPDRRGAGRPRLLAFLVAGILNENSPHGFRSRREKMSTAVPAPLVSGADQSHIRFMHQGGGLQCLPRLLLTEFPSREAAQLVVDQRQQQAGGVRIALFDGVQDLSYVVHRK
jgi:hypothetical protein